MSKQSREQEKKRDLKRLQEADNPTDRALCYLDGGINVLKRMLERLDEPRSKGGMS